MSLMGRSLNVISLAGLAFAVGMLVDNAVVVLENIYRHRQQGQSPVKAAALGTQEVAGAVIASTLTTIAVFVPVLFVQESSGQLFRDIALAISCAVGLSMIVSFTVIPTASARLFGKAFDDGDHDERPQDTGVKQAADSASLGRSVRALQWAGAKFTDAVAGTNQWIVARRSRSLAVVAIMVAVSAGVSYALWPEVEYLPEGNRNFVFCTLSPPPGYNIEQLMKMGEVMENDLRP